MQRIFITEFINKYDIKEHLAFEDAEEMNIYTFSNIKNDKNVFPKTTVLNFYKTGTIEFNSDQKSLLKALKDKG